MKKLFVTWNWLLWPALALAMLSTATFAKDCPDAIGEFR